MERFILAVLETKAFSQEKELFRYYIAGDENDLGIMLDAYAPYGLDDYRGPTVFEIKYVTQHTRYTIKRTIEQCRVSGTKIRELVLILPYTSLTEDNDLPTKYGDTQISYLDKRAIRKWMEEYRQDYLKYLASPEEILSDASEIFYKQDNLKHKNSIKKLYKKNNLVFVLGAGVSRDYKSKKWDEMIEDFENDLVARLSINTKILDDAKELIGKNQLTSIQLWKDVFMDQKRNKKTARGRYYKLIHEALYPSGNTFPMYLNNTALNEIAALYAFKTDIHNDKIVTYNYDDHLENELSKHGVDHESIFYPKQLSSDGLSVYHVHGYLPYHYDKLLDDEKLKYEDSIVLSEHDYNNLYNNHMLWNISVQLNIAREKTCLFIGHGLRDPNLLRLFKMLNEENSKLCHYAIIKIEDEYDPVAYNLFQTRLARIGINIIWIDDFKEIPAIIRSLG